MTISLTSNGYSQSCPSSKDVEKALVAGDIPTQMKKALGNSEAEYLLLSPKLVKVENRADGKLKCTYNIGSAKGATFFRITYELGN